jgi:uncharacterized protein (AIM24 family)
LAAPGDVVVHTVAADRELFIQRGSFLGCWPNVQTDAKFKGFKGFLSGEGLFFLRAFTTDGDTHTLSNDDACSMPA